MALRRLKLELKLYKSEYNKALSSNNLEFQKLLNGHHAKKAEIEKAWKDQIDLVATEIFNVQEEKKAIENARALYDSQVKAFMEQTMSLSSKLCALETEKKILEEKIM